MYGLLIWIIQFIKRCLCVFRVKKLKETLVAVQQLDKNMSNLRSWLSRMEAELSRPITYSVCHHQEIQRRLAEQQVDRNTPNHTYQLTLVHLYIFMRSPLLENSFFFCLIFLFCPHFFVFFLFCDIFLFLSSICLYSIVCIVAF